MRGKWGLIIALLIVFSLFSVFAYSVDYYIEESIKVNQEGTSLITGKTNLDFLSVHPVDEKISGSTDELTSKKGKLWLFSYEPKKNVSAAVIDIELPKGAAVNYVHSQLQVTIESQDDIITLKFFGENKDSSIKIQYSIVNTSNSYNYFSLLIPAIIVIAVLALGFAVFSLLKRFRPVGKRSINMDKLSTIRPTLNETEIKILDALLEKKGELSQTAISYMTGIPKSSLSRNIELMVQKNLLQKFFNGTSNYIKIHPSLRKE